MFDEPLRTRLTEVEQIQQAAKRGHEFEGLVAELFRLHHFDVRADPGTARPRQTDLLASRISEVYLIECKWRRDKASIDDLDTLRSRLRRTGSPGVVGILVSFTGFTGTVISDVTHDRSQPILLISGEEIHAIVGWPELLPRLLRRKKDALLIDGRVLLDEQPEKRPARRRAAPLPAATLQFVMPAGAEPASSIECRGDFGMFVFAHELPDVDWVPALGKGMSLDVEPRIPDERGLLELIDHLANLGWATADARWSIQQSHRNWHGFGAASFAAELPLWRPRAAPPDAHHTEEFCYVDRCDGGFYTLSGQLSAHRSRRTTRVSLSFQLQGIPLDSSALQQLCRSAGVDGASYFRPLAKRSVKRQRWRRHQWRSVAPVGYVISPETELGNLERTWVTGIVVPNPLFQVSRDDANADLASALGMVEDSELVVCDLTQHHLLGDESIEYYFTGFESARTSEVLVVRPTARWESGSRQGDQRPSRRTWPPIVDIQPAPSPVPGSESPA